VRCVTTLAALIALECGVFALGAALIEIAMHGPGDPATEGLLLAAGVLFGVSDIALKYLTEALHGGLNGIVSEWTLTALAASALAFYTSACGLQLGPGVALTAYTFVAANLAAIMGGILVFRDPIGIGALAIVGRVIAFALVIAGAATMPPPLQAGETPERCRPTPCPPDISTISESILSTSATLRPGQARSLRTMASTAHHVSMIRNVRKGVTGRTARRLA
jgi:hypothetical protein